MKCDHIIGLASCNGYEWKHQRKSHHLFLYWLKVDGIGDTKDLFELDSLKSYNFCPECGVSIKKILPYFDLQK